MKKKLTLLSILFFGIFLFTACSEKNSDIPAIPEGGGIQLRAGWEQKVEQDNAFAFDLFKTTCKFDNEPNVFVSPLSVGMCLSMVLNGAKGDTRSEMEKALHVAGFSPDEINDYCKTLREALIEVDPSTEVAIANSIWNRLGFSVKPDFLQVNQLNFNAEIKEVDFANPNTVKQINNWCAQNTNNRITEIIDKIPGDAVMYLINAVYFKGIWCTKFEEKNTFNQNFYAAGGTKQVKIMTLRSDFKYSSDKNADYLELPYGNKSFSMITMLPREGKTVDDVIRNLNQDSWNAALQNMKTEDVRLQMPRFKTECKYMLHEKILPDMGMKLPFSPGLADFSGISDMSLYISSVIHKTFLEVNEKGTEAAAVTAVEVGVTSAGPGPRIINYIIDKPFVLAIYEKSTGVILFIGKIGNPES